MEREIYLDNSATTRAFPEVGALVAKIMTEDYGNPSSMHRKGMEAEHYVRDARESLAKILKVSPKEILFTSGGTESDNLAILGGAKAMHRRGKHLITTRVEHPAVLETMKELEKQGFEVTYLDVDREGRIRPEELERSLREDTILVSIMHTNNEIGSVMPIEEAGAIIKRHNPETLFHVDAVQGFGKAYIYPKKAGIDLLSVSAHKIHGPKGVGFLYVSDKVRILPTIFGGGQQKGMRSGTENVPGIAGMALAADLLYRDAQKEWDRLYELKELLTKGLKSLENVTINGPAVRDGAPHIISASFDGVRSEVLLHALEDKGIYVSAGSACASNRPHISETLTAIELPASLRDGTIRFSLSTETTKEDIEDTVEALGSILPMLRRFVRK